jgi:WhiB family redox-sensing transcriptional regulator
MKHWWFPEQHNHVLGEYAKKVCAECPVEEQCLEWALQNDEQHGIWGGTTPKQRMRIRKKRA